MILEKLQKRSEFNESVLHQIRSYMEDKDNKITYETFLKCLEWDDIDYQKILYKVESRHNIDLSDLDDWINNKEKQTVGDLADAMFALT